MMGMVEHILEMAGATVKIVDGSIEVLSDPLVKRCPLREDLYRHGEESRETVEMALREHMEALGMYGAARVLELRDGPVAFGAAEIMADALKAGLLDAAVTVCEGAGTAVITRPEVLLAVGAHMTGLLRTDPIPEIQDGLIARGCILLGQEAAIDQLEGWRKAQEAGFRRIGVTISGSRADDARAIRESGDAAILAVHTTGIDEEKAQILAESCDLVWGCASRAVRDVVGLRASMQMGIAIPVYAMTVQGKRLLLNRAIGFRDPLVVHRARLPLAGGREPEPLI